MDRGRRERRIQGAAGKAAEEEVDADAPADDDNAAWRGLGDARQAGDPHETP